MKAYFYRLILVSIIVSIFFPSSGVAGNVATGPIGAMCSFDDMFYPECGEYRLYIGTGTSLALESYQFSGKGYSFEYTLNAMALT
jgi:hypothetical protein